jgi:hypothetical protein
MQEGKNMGIMITLKKPTAERVLPRRAGNLVGAGLGLSGADVAAGFAAAGRFTQIGRLAGAGVNAIRGTSTLLQATKA